MTIIHIEKMVADNTIWLDTPICGCKKIRVIKCFFENKLKNLPTKGQIIVSGGSTVLIPAGNYNLKEISIELNKHPLITFNLSEKTITSKANLTLNKSIANLLGLTSLIPTKYTSHVIKFLESPNAFYLQCSVVDRRQVMVGDNGKHLPILTFFPIKDSIYSYVSSTYIPTENCDYINRIQFRVTDVNNNLIEDGIYPMHLTIEII